MFAEIATELVVLVLLLVVNGVFAMSEIAIVTARRVRLEQRMEQGDRGAAAALALAHEPTQFLSTVQVGITLVGVLAGAFGATTLAEVLAVRLAAVPALAPYAEPLSLTLVVGGITYLSLVIGELVPKRIALGAPERIAVMIARPMRALSRVTAPVVQVLTGSTNLMLRLLGVRPHAEPGVTEDEIRAVLEQGSEFGVIQRAEHEIVESVFRLGDRTVRAIMTPRPEVDWIDIADDEPDTSARLVRYLEQHRRALVLVAEQDLDHVVGFVHVEDLLAASLGGSAVNRDALRAAARQPLFVPTVMPVLRLVETFRAARRHAAVVLDEYGGVSGIVTLHDVLEGLVGDLPSVGDVVEELPIVQRGDGSWLVDGALPIGEVEALLDLPVLGHGRGDYETLAGFVLAGLARMPVPGDAFTWRDSRFEVVDMDGRRIDKVLVVPATPPSDAASAAHRAHLRHDER